MIQVISRAVDIMAVLEYETEGLTLSELSSRVKLPRSTVHRIVKTLEDERLLERVPTNRGYTLGPVLLRIASSGPAWLIRHLHGYLRDLSREINETVDLSLRAGDHIYFVDQIPGQHRLQAVSGIGINFPLHCTAPGKAMLSSMSRQEIEAVVGKSPKRHTATTITNLPRLTQEIQKIKKTKIAYDREEHHQGICAVGTLIDNPLGLPVAVSVPVPSARFEKSERFITKQLLLSRATIERSLLAASRH